MKKIILCTILIFALIISSFTVFSADPDPYAGRQIIILRLDDLRSRTTGAFEWALNAATERNVKVSFGVIGDALDDGVCNRRFIDFVTTTITTQCIKRPRGNEITSIVFDVC